MFIVIPPKVILFLNMGQYSTNETRMKCRTMYRMNSIHRSLQLSFSVILSAFLYRISFAQKFIHEKNFSKNHGASLNPCKNMGIIMAPYRLREYSPPLRHQSYIRPRSNMA